MTEIVHLKCDRCGNEVHDDDRRLGTLNWARIKVDLRTFHLCPQCWQNIRDAKV